LNISVLLKKSGPQEALTDQAATRRSSAIEKQRTTLALSSLLAPACRRPTAPRAKIGWNQEIGLAV